MKNEAKWIWLAQHCGVASNEMISVVEKIGSIRDIYLADYETYIECGISERLAEKLSDKSLESAYTIIKRCNELGAGILCYSDEAYPKSLRSLKDPPAVLYYAGKLPDLNSHLCIATVGTRKMSEYGMRSAYKIAYEVAASGAVIVSGMALGIDAVCAGAAIAARGKTVAVLGCGIDVVYPKQHAKLCEAIKEHGAIITEYPPSVEPRGFHFPIRNRIISGISQGTTVIDADINSGSMITAKTAILQGRDIYAVPCNIDSEKSGTNELIRDGAQAVVSGYDIIKNYVYAFKDVLNVKNMKEAETRSEFDASRLASLSIKARGEAPAFEGASAQAERMAAENSAKREKSQKINEKATSADTKKRDIKDRDTKENLFADCKEVAVSAQNGDGDKSRAALESLNERHRRIFDEMPLDKAIPVDYLIKAGFRPVEVIAALTVLEVKGLVSSLPGALYIRK